MECEEIKASLLECLREELQPGRRAEVERHLTACQSCASVYEAAAGCWRALDHSVNQPSPRLREGFYALLGRAGAAVAPNEGRAWGFFPARFRSPAWVYAYSFALMLSGMLVGETLRPAERLAGVDLFAQESAGELTRERLVQLCSVNGAGLN